MGKQRSLMKALILGRRVDFSSKKGFAVLKAIHFSFLLVSSLSILLLLQKELTYGSLIISSVFSLTMVFIYLFLHRNLKLAAIKGDMLIIRSMNNKTVLTSIRSIRGLKTRTFFFVHITHFEYFLDGGFHNVILVSSRRIMPISPERSIKKAQEISENKKANHKPDSVLVA